jgi:hypothetical protein
MKITDILVPESAQLGKLIDPQVASEIPSTTNWKSFQIIADCSRHQHPHFTAASRLPYKLRDITG